MAKRASPTQRTLEYARKRGWLAGVVERRNPALKFKTHDLFGFADVMAVDPHRGKVLLIQTTARSSLAARQHKLEGQVEDGADEKARAAGARVAEAVRTCVLAGVIVECWGWRRLKVARGGKAVRWEVLRRRAHVRPGAGELVWEDVDA